VGAKPIAITNCLNFGNPDNGPIAYQLGRAIEGMAEACEALGTPVISGNVSLYNESFEQPIYPTAVVGMLGLMDDVTANCTISFKDEGDVVYLLGDAIPVLDGSEYQKRWYGGARGRPVGRIPDVDLDAEVALQGLVRRAIGARLLRSAHDVADGGLAVAVAESCIAGKIGVSLTPARKLHTRPDIAFFGETPTLVVVSVAPTKVDEFERMCRTGGVSATALGVVGGAEFVAVASGVVEGDGGTIGVRAPVAALEELYETALPRAMGE
jgi:phosphoribosylformylglycinamidine synthase